MSKYLVETFYTCTFKIVHKLDELNEKKISDLENRNDGKFEIIDIKLNNRKTKTIDNKNKETFFDKTEENNIPGFSNLVNKKISDKDKTDNKNELGKENTNIQKLPSGNTTSTSRPQKFKKDRRNRP